jgi:ABC-2 type transport system ATP-binding protein
LIREIRDAGTTVVITTHYMDEAEVLCDRVAFVDGGHIIGIDTPDHFIDQLVATGFERAKQTKGANLEDVFINLTGKEWRERAPQPPSRSLQLLVSSLQTLKMTQ